MWVPARHSNMDDPLVEISDNLYPTMIICNPNAGFYEYMYYSSEWLEYYISNGINVVLWNYRGYGRSTGSPSPNNLKKDAEILYTHLKSARGCAKIGVHGQSLGGMVACHLARKFNVEFVFADRTFCSIDSIVIK